MNGIVAKSKEGAYCDVCGLRGDCPAMQGTAFLQCYECNVFFHDVCYSGGTMVGEIKKGKQTGKKVAARDIFCDKCRFVHEKGDEFEVPTCDLCPVKGGALKPTFRVIMKKRGGKTAPWLKSKQNLKKKKDSRSKTPPPEALKAPSPVPTSIPGLLPQTGPGGGPGGFIPAPAAALAPTAPPLSAPAPIIPPMKRNESTTSQTSKSEVSSSSPKQESSQAEGSEMTGPGFCIPVDNGGDNVGVGPPSVSRKKKVRICELRRYSQYLTSLTSFPPTTQPSMRLATLVAGVLVPRHVRLLPREDVLLRATCPSIHVDQCQQRRHG